MARTEADFRAPDPPPGHAGLAVRLAKGQLHEVHAGAEDWACALAFGLAAIETDASRPVLLVRTRRRGAGMVPCGEGLQAFGIDPARLVIVDAPGDAGLLRAGLDAARSSGPAAVLMESWGRLREYDMVASRRLILAAEHSGIPVVMLRGDAEPRASAAHSRWTVSAAPSTPQEARAPGPAALLVELVRRRGGPAGMRWRLEWNDEHGGFRERLLDFSEPALESTAEGSASPSGAVVPFPAVRAGEGLRRTA